MPQAPFPAPAADPFELYRLRDAIYTVDLLTVAIVHLDLFTRLAPGPRPVEELRRELEIVERPTDVLLSCCASLGLLTLKGGAVELTSLAREHLVVGSPWYLGAYYAAFRDRPVTLDLLQVLRTGRPASWASSKSEKEWASAMEGEDFADRFTAAMDCRGTYLGPALAAAVPLRQSARLLDLGGGSGVYACALAARNPNLRATVLEKPPVDRVAARWIKNRGFESRVDVCARDMFSSPFPGGYDVHLYSNVLHDWDVPRVKELLHRSREALLPGGQILIHDAHLNRQKTGPREVAEYSVILMHATEGRCYSIGEIEMYLKEAGFGDFREAPTAAGRSVVVAKKLG